MNSDLYIMSVLKKYNVESQSLTGLTGLLLLQSLTPTRIMSELRPLIKDWAGQYLNAVLLSGSTAKNTAIKGTADVDLFISLKAVTPVTLKDIFYSLNDYFSEKGFDTRIQNVSIGLSYKGKKVDLVPGKIQQGYLNYHSLYKSKKDSWVQTNIIKHINLVKNSGRISEIRAIKIWRMLNQLDFPSIYLELSVIEALKGKRKNQLSVNVATVLDYLATQFVDKIVIDPSNTNNVISSEIFKKDKQLIAKTAKESLKKAWNEVLY